MADNIAIKTVVLGREEGLGMKRLLATPDLQKVRRLGTDGIGLMLQPGEVAVIRSEHPR